MAKTINGIKIIKRYSFGLFLSAIIMLCVVAVPVLSIFFPYFKVTDPSHIIDTASTTGIISYNIIDVFKGMLAQFGVIQDWPAGMNALCTTQPTELYASVFKWFVIGEAIVACLFAIVAVVMFFMSIVAIFAGKLNTFKAPFKISIYTLILGILFGGGPLVGSIFYGIVYAGAQQVAVSIDLLFPIIYTAVPIVACILLGIIYKAAFKGRVFADYVARINAFGFGNDVTQQQPVNNTDVVGQPIAYNPQPINIYNTVPGDNTKVKNVTKIISKQSQTLPRKVSSIGGHAYSQNAQLKVAIIPLGITYLGAGAFANCPNLKTVSIPTSVKEIDYNCFFNCVSLERINYAGTKNQWKHVKRGSNWLTKAGTTTVVCSDGAVTVNPYH